MIVALCNTGYRYDVQSICQLFFPREKFSEENGKKLTVTLLADRAQAVLCLDGKVYENTQPLGGSYDNVRTAVKKCAYTVLSAATGKQSEWGIVTGIRPAVLYEKLLAVCGEGAYRIFNGVYGVSPEKTALCTEVLKNRKAAVGLLSDDSSSLYISIPFCPSRCRYCSFVSESTEKEKGQIPAYVRVLCRELESTSQAVRRDGKKLNTVYIGGGTPTVLAPAELVQLLSTVNNLFLTEHPVREFTVEAGRPDTITAQKLDLMRRYGVTRVSVNPQTLDDGVLARIGRRHTAADFYKAYTLAAKYSFCKNVDLIAGLPGDSVSGFRRTLDAVLALQPENVTVHTLYLKRASEFGAYGNVATVRQAAEQSDVSEMLSYAQQSLFARGYGPYYLYRQKNTLGNLENVGYSLPGKECLYNIYMMDDLQQIYGAGAGAVTKIKTETGVKRINNTKFGYNYMKEKGGLE